MVGRDGSAVGADEVAKKHQAEISW
ncbi:hypothetical protein DSM3645_10177 [Blastopirellula marina DSM 3645]|uniref:Uncharacterized protein n=1 Tax=Blastopirellula marina DSM 3645 TaxID=314230 RepID=A3ZLX6_9BACT|nr:hypothetical protein DSM3645_10177 [Blastopirellula marina DSM 3645]